MAHDGDRFLKVVKERARLFVDTNFAHPRPADYLLIETAILIGISMASTTLTEAEASLVECDPKMGSQIQNLLDKLWGNG